MHIFILSQDLLVTARAGSFADSLKASVTPFSSLAHLQAAWKESPAKVVTIDLTLRGLDVEEVIQWIRSQQAGVKVIAFGPHVHVKNLAHAEQSGSDQVYVRGEFFSQMQAIFSRALTEDTISKEEE